MASSSEPKRHAGQRIEAADFQAPGENSQSIQQSYSAAATLDVRSDVPWWHSQFNLMLCVFALLAVAAGLFIVLTPPPTTVSSSTVVDSDGSTRVEQSTVSTEVAPWDESRRAQARTDSQDILSQLLQSKKDLEAKNVTDWAGERYDSALSKAADGDNFYKQQDYVQAIENYQAALDEINNLNGLIPDILKTKVAEGQAAIKDGKTLLAKEMFQEALRLDKNHIPALSGLDRVKTLDQVLQLVRAATADEQEFQRTDDINSLTLALQKYQQAVALDSQFEVSAQGLSRVKEAAADKRFRDSMSTGFAALFAGRYANARAGFSSALKIRPSDAVASSAYKQSLASDKRSSLSSLLTAAKRFEKNEEWASALSNYQVVLQRDPNQISAKLGKIRSKARADLDQSLKSALTDTLDLGRATQRERAGTILADAAAIKNKGAVLQGQISQLETALKQAGSSVRVAFTSDALTNITLQKEGAKKIQLGKFSSKKLALKPGRYVVTGQRLGFHDVRKQIELRAVGSQVQTFSIACDSPIAGESSASLASRKY